MMRVDHVVANVEVLAMELLQFETGVDRLLFS
jgi:hypothetical protein